MHSPALLNLELSCHQHEHGNSSSALKKIFYCEILCEKGTARIETPIHISWQIKSSVYKEALSSDCSDIEVMLDHYDTDLTFDQGAAQNMKNGGAAGQGQVRRQNNASALGTGGMWVRVLANTLKEIKLPHPISLAEGEGFMCRTTTTNVFLGTNWFWREV